MTDLHALDAYLQAHLSPHRYAHCLGTAQCARELALRFGADADKAYLAGMAHDMSKWMKGKEYLRYAQEAGIQPDAYQLANPGLLHAQVSAHLLQTLFGEQDEDVLQAIRLHMGGAPNMRKLDACVCLADWIEPGRDFPDVPELRKLAERSLELALRQALATTIILLLQEGRVVQPNSLDTYNTLTQMLNRKEALV